MRTIPCNDARANLGQVIDQVVDDVDVTLITRRDAPNAIVLSQEHYDSLMETVHLLRSPENVAHPERSISQARAGKVKPRELVEDPTSGRLPGTLDPTSGRLPGTLARTAAS